MKTILSKLLILTVLLLLASLPSCVKQPAPKPTPGKDQEQEDDDKDYYDDEIKGADEIQDDGNSDGGDDSDDDVNI